MSVSGNVPQVHPKTFEPSTFVVSALVTMLSAIVCMTIMGRLGIVPNTSIIGALIAIALGRTLSSSFRSLDRQNLVQTMTSAGGFGAGNAIFVPVTMMLLMGRGDLLWPMMIGATAGAVIDVLMVGRIFDSAMFPAEYPWPPGVATAQAIIAGDEGGRKARRLVEGVAAGILGSIFKIPMAGFGVAYIANIYAMTALGVGLVLRGYSMKILGFDLGKTYIPHGIMIGASIVQLIQAIKVMTSKEGSSRHEIEGKVTVPFKAAVSALNFGFWGFAAISVALMVFMGLTGQMSATQIVLFLVWSTFTAWASTVICGLCAMNAGWFPSTAIIVIFLMIGIFLGLPPLPLAVLAGYGAATGPCFADMGYDLKTGWILRTKHLGRDLQYEVAGRREQVKAEVVGVIIAMVAVMLFGKMYFDQGFVPPFPKLFKAAIEAGRKPEILRTMVIWAIPGAIIQILSGPRRAMGTLLGVGLLIQNPLYGIGCLAGVICRKITGDEPMEIRAAGILAGDGIYGFLNALVRTYF